MKFGWKHQNKFENDAQDIKSMFLYLQNQGVAY